MKRSTLMALVVFVVLAVGVVWSLTREKQRGVSRLTFAELDAESVDKVEITGKNAVTLLKQGDAWTVQPKGKVADTNMVKRLIEAIPTIDTTDLVTQSAERYTELEVDEEKGTHVKAYAGGNVAAEFTVGKSAKGGSYVRAGDAVYSAPRVYASTFSREASQWMERKLFQDKLADVQAIEVNLAGQPSYGLVQKDNAWALEDASLLPQGFRFDANQARSLVSGLINGRAADILDEDPGVAVTGLGDGADVFAFTVETGDGEAKSSVRHELRLGKAKAEEKKVYAQVTGKADIITLAEHAAKSLRKAPTDFRDLKMMANVTADKATKITIVDGKRRLTLEKQGAEWKVGASSEAIPKEFSLDPMMVTRRLTAVANARGAAVAADQTLATAGLSRPTASVTVTLEDKTSAKVVFGKATKDDNRDMVFAAGNADDAVYLVTKWTQDSLTGGLDSFKKKAAPGGMGGLGGLDPSALSGLPPDVRAGLMKQIQQKQQQQKMIEQMQQQAEQQKQSQ